MNAKVGQFKRFLDAVEAKQVPAGSMLILENLDRLSRDETSMALKILMGLCHAGIILQTLDPEETYTNENINDPMMIMKATLTFSRGYEESKRKSYLSKANWADAREKSKAGMRALTGQGPRWLKVTPDFETAEELKIDPVYELMPERVAVIKRLVEWALAGRGFMWMAKRLNEEKVKPFGFSAMWSPVYVQMVLTNPALFGRFTPTCDGKPQEPIDGLYPVVITEDEFHAVQAALAVRQKRGGRNRDRVTNLFGGLLKDTTDGCSMYFAGSRTKKWGFLLASSGALHSKPGSKYQSFPYLPLERAFCGLILEIKPSDILPKKANGEQDEQAELSKRLDGVHFRLAKLQEEMADPTADPSGFGVLVKAATALQKQEVELSQALDALRARRSTVVSETLGECQSVLWFLEGAKPEERNELRHRLRARIAALVDVVWMTITCEGPSKFSPKSAEVKVVFKSGTVAEFVVMTASDKRPTVAFRPYDDDKGNHVIMFT
jgi:hypothetical protein